MLSVMCSWVWKAMSEFNKLVFSSIVFVLASVCAFGNYLKLVLALSTFSELAMDLSILYYKKIIMKPFCLSVISVFSCVAFIFLKHVVFLYDSDKQKWRNRFHYLIGCSKGCICHKLYFALYVWILHAVNTNSTAQKFLWSFTWDCSAFEVLEIRQVLIIAICIWSYSTYQLCWGKIA